MRSLPQFFAVVMLLLAGVLIARPAPASACIWRIADQGNPFPPCDQEDTNEIARLRQANLKIGQKLVTVVAKIRTVRKEVRGSCPRSGRSAPYGSRCP